MVGTGYNARPKGRSGFDGCLSDPETKSHKEGGKMVISKNFLDLNSPTLASGSLGPRISFKPMQATRLGELPLHQMAFSINSHTGEEVQGLRTEEGEEETQKEKEKKKKSKVEVLPNCRCGSFPTSFL